jgi:hypothetical protein
LTLQHPEGIVSAYTIIRGAENIPINIGDLTLDPKSAKLTLHKIENTLFQPIAWVPVVNITEGSGLVYQTSLSVTSGNLNFLEGCYHLHTPYNQPFPGTILSTGTGEILPFELVTLHGTHRHFDTIIPLFMSTSRQN